MGNGVQDIKPSPGLSQRERLLEMLIEALPELLQSLPNAQVKEVVTLRVFIDEYKNLIQHNRSSSYLKSVRVAFDYLIDYLTQKDGRPALQKSIDTIDLKDIENLLIYLQQKVRKGYVVYYRNLKAAFNKAKEWGYVKENYFTKVKLPKRQKTAPAYINSEQLAVISKQLTVNSKQYAVGSKQKGNNVLKDIVVVAYYTGMRLSEIINLTWRNVNMATRIITVGDEHFSTKSRSQRFIPFNEEVKEIFTRIIDAKLGNTPRILRIHPSDRGEFLEQYVFCKKNGERFCSDYVSKSFKKACAAAGIDRSIHFHSLRHSFASNLAQKGVSLYTIKELLGHSSISTTEIYSHLNMESLKEAIRVLN